jgi:lysophospholipid acyltransferase (LPLAT)-like uncharacterized protein
MSARTADWRTRWTARLGVGLVWLLARTWRVRYVNDTALREARRRREPVLIAIWHGQLLAQLWAHRGQSISVLISDHRDGELIARIAEAMGYRTVRGSTTRGGSRALVAMAQELAAGFDVGVTPDGPRGPYHSFAAGALLVSQRSARPIVPFGAHASRAWHLGSWDRFTIPKPFARVTIAYGDFISPPAGNPRELAAQTERYRAALDAAVARAAEAVEAG